MKLIAPMEQHVRQIEEYRREFLNSGDSMDGCSWLEKYENAEKWIEFNRGLERAETTPPGLVPAKEYIYVREKDSKIVGMINLRLALNEYLEKFGGHIGYSVAPSERRQGYAKQMLALALEEYAQLGIDPVLITCLTTNEASRRTILANGGKYESTVTTPDGKEVERYWVPTRYAA